MAKPTPKPFMQAVATHRQKLERLMSVKAAQSMKGVYDEAQTRLLNKMAKLVQAKRGDSFTANQLRLLQAQVRQGQQIIANRLAGDMRPLSREAQKTALSGLIKDVARLSQTFTGSELTLPIAEASVFQGIIDARENSLMRMHKESMSRFGAKLVQDVEKEMAVSLVAGESTADVMDKVTNLIDGEWWQGERIVRTEMSFAYNSTDYDGIRKAAEEIPELMQRWEENCNAQGEPLDKRVAVDSIAIHGQVAPAGGVFTMPSVAPFPDSEGRTVVPAHLAGLSWPFPPNRPNDRSVISPWMPDWGVPGWQYVNGKRVPL